MWFWITIIMLAFILIAFLEELIYYLWNQYIYGKKQNLWIQKIIEGFSRLKKKRQKEVEPEQLPNDIDSP
ncbi:hypothetical protein [Neobacillus mesonae]|uniref:hypothetical protein n=1 Tax=Neobacillus mesonae TaxID=1193713 RepID=UPI0020404FB8|nr:hypothetical protein [Neobacillus mesonae]MCM3566969.1 hypothetical protein [Neobacillus mesonae]